MTTSEMNEFIEEYGACVFSFCRRIAVNREDAEDLYQETMLRAIENSKRIERGNNPKSYLMGIAVKLWAYQKRREARRHNIAPMQTLSDDAEKGTEDCYPETLVLQKEKQDLVQQAVASIPDQLRAVVSLYYTAELPVKEIGKLLGIPQGTVKSRLHKAREMVREIMEEQNYDRV